MKKLMMLLALLLCVALPALAEDEIIVDMDAVEEVDDLEIVLEDVPEEEDMPEGEDLPIVDESIVLDVDLTEDPFPIANNTVVTNDGEDIPIDAAHFPDANFRSFVAEFCDTFTYDSPRDGVLNADERRNVTQIWVDGRGISDLRGIEYFPALRNCA